MVLWNLAYNKSWKNRSILFIKTLMVIGLVALVLALAYRVDAAAPSAGTVSVQTVYQYDALNRMTNRVISDRLQQSWQYDAVGNETNMWTSAGYREVKTYNAVGRMIESKSFGPPQIANLPQTVPVQPGQRAELPLQVSYGGVTPLSNLTFSAANLVRSSLLPTNLFVVTATTSTSGTGGTTSNSWVLNLYRPVGLIGLLRGVVVVSDGYITSSNLVVIGPPSSNDWSIGAKPAANGDRTLRSFDGVPTTALPVLQIAPKLLPPR